MYHSGLETLVVTYFLHFKQLWTWISVIASNWYQKKKDPVSEDNTGLGISLREIKLKLRPIWTASHIMRRCYTSCQGRKAIRSPTQLENLRITTLTS